MASYSKAITLLDTLVRYEYLCKLTKGLRIYEEFAFHIDRLVICLLMFYFVNRHFIVWHAQAHNRAKHATCHHGVVAPTIETTDRASDASTVFSRFFIKNLSNDAPRSLNQNETSKNGGSQTRARG